MCLGMDNVRADPRQSAISARCPAERETGTSLYIIEHVDPELIDTLTIEHIRHSADRGLYMKKAFVIAMAAGLVSLSACNSSPTEQAADNIESNTEAVADNLEDAADNVGNDAAEASLENKADAVRATGQNQAEDMRTNDPDTNLSNGI
jgi:hypothetical protein